MANGISHLILIDIDGLRHDVFSEAWDQKKIPNIIKILGGEHSLRLPVIAPAPSITFCSQATLFTGAHPHEHGIPGNQFFDRFGRYGNGTPRHYAFDVGDTLAVDDAVRVYTSGLASNCLQVPTIYERLAERGWRSAVATNMYAAGADAWLKPTLIDLARFTKGARVISMQAAVFDRRTLNATTSHVKKNGMPEVLTLYFLGLDQQSHKHGPHIQFKYLTEQIDPMLGELWHAIDQEMENPLVAAFSDHGQIAVKADDRHSLRLSFPFERELGHLFDALGLDVHDYPGEDPHCDAVVASNGGMAFVYLQNRTGHWSDRPRFERDVLSVGQAFWEAHQTGKYATEIEGSLAGVLLRNVEQDGWNAAYQALTADNEIVSLDTWFEGKKDLYLDPTGRLNRLASPMTGDLILLSNYEDGFYFSAPYKGMHGGLHPEDSTATLAYGFPKADDQAAAAFRQTISLEIEKRCLEENGRAPGTVDLVTGLLSVL